MMMAAKQQQLILWGVAIGAIFFFSLLILTYWYQIPSFQQRKQVKQAVVLPPLPLLIPL